MHAPFLGLKVNRYPLCLQAIFEGKAQDLTPECYMLIWQGKEIARPGRFFLPQFRRPSIAKQVGFGYNSKV